MAQEPNVDRLRAAYLKLQADLVKQWEHTLDENGTFSFVFGDPSETPCTFSSYSILPFLCISYPIAHIESNSNE